MAIQRKGTEQQNNSAQGSTANSAPKKQTSKGNGSNKKEGNVAKIVGIVVGVAVLGIVICIGVASFKHRKTALKPEEMMPSRAENVGGVMGNQNGNKTGNKPKAPLPEDNNFDPNKTQQASGATQEGQQKKTFTAEELAHMSKEERNKALKDTVDNRQDSKPQGFLSKEQIANSKLKLGFKADTLAQRDDYANYTKHTTKTGDKTFLLWLDLNYKGKKYYAVVDPLYWDRLEDIGIIPVSVSYFIDASNNENILAIKPTETE